jgi:hypothetical protein
MPGASETTVPSSLPQTTICTAIQRGVLNPRFSKRSIVDFQPVICEKLESLCDKIAKYAEGNGEQVLCLNYAWSAWAGDLITEDAFGF